jgi:hypothetical protein
MFGKAFLSMMKPDAGESISISCLIFPLVFSRAISRSGTCHRFNRSVAASNSDRDPWDPAAPPGTMLCTRSSLATLGRHQLRAIDGQERLALSHLFVCCVGVYLLHPAGEANLHVGKPRLVRLDVSDGADLVADRSKLYDAGLYPDALHPLRCQRDRR